MVSLMIGLQTSAGLQASIGVQVMAENLVKNTGPILGDGEASSTQGGDATLEVLHAI